METLERWIDALDGGSLKLTSFLLVVGRKGERVFAFQARVVCRRAERRCVPLVRAGAVPDVAGVPESSERLHVHGGRLSPRCDAGREEESYKKA